MTPDLCPHHRKIGRAFFVLDKKKRPPEFTQDITLSHMYKSQKIVQKFIQPLFFTLYYRYQNVFVLMKFLLKRNGTLLSIFLFIWS